MLAFANVMHFLADEFSRLRAGRFSFARVLVCTFDDLFFRHKTSLARRRIDSELLLLQHLSGLSRENEQLLIAALKRCATQR